MKKIIASTLIALSATTAQAHQMDEDLSTIVSMLYTGWEECGFELTQRSNMLIVAAVAETDQKHLLTHIAPLIRDAEDLIDSLGRREVCSMIYNVGQDFFL